MIGLIFFLTVLANSEFITAGLDINFNIKPNTVGSYSFKDYSCQKILCKANPFISLAPLANYLDCQILPFVNQTNMVVIGLSSKNSVIVANVCYNDSECLQKSCSIYNSFANVDWLVFTGQCL